MRVLVADDDAVARTMLATNLERWGFRPLVVDNGTAALDALTRLRPRLAILDWMMPGIDGIEVCRRIRQDAAATPYVILLTGRTEHTDVVAGLDAGADDYVSKPFDIEELRARVNVGRRLVVARSESEHLLTAISSILIGLDGENRIIRWNAAATEAFGITSAQAFGQTLSECGIVWIDPDAVATVIGSGDEIVRADDVRVRNAAGQERILGLTMTPLRQEDGTVGRILLGADVTNRRLLESQLRQAQKLEGIGQLAAGIAHEINTPMQYIGDNLRFLGESIATMQPLLAAIAMLPGDGAGTASIAAAVRELRRAAEAADLEFIRRNLPDALAQSLEGVQQVSRIVRAMKEFSHPGRSEKVAVDLNRAVETTLVVASNELKYVADVRLALDPALPSVTCLPGEINQVLLNLLLNAAHAIAERIDGARGERGTITIATAPAGDFAEIQITDTGAGIPEAVRTRVFEPFFTTKDVGRGTGQGLAIAHATIVNHHGGQIWFDSTVGKGTTFYIRLPLASACTGESDVAPAA